MKSELYLTPGDAAVLLAVGEGSAIRAYYEIRPNVSLKTFKRALNSKMVSEDTYDKLQMIIYNTDAPLAHTHKIRLEKILDLVYQCKINKGDEDKVEELLEEMYKFTEEYKLIRSINEL